MNSPKARVVLLIVTLTLVGCMFLVLVVWPPAEGQLIPDDQTRVLALLEMYCYRNKGEFPEKPEDAMDVLYGEDWKRKARIGDCLYRLYPRDKIFTYYVDRETKRPVLIFHETGAENIAEKPSEREGQLVDLAGFNWPENSLRNRDAK